jgi:hypothetical protein
MVLTLGLLIQEQLVLHCVKMSIETFVFIIYLQTVLSGLMAVIALYKYQQRNHVVRLIGLLYAISFVCNVMSMTLRQTRWSEFINIPGSIFDITFVVICAVIYNYVFKKKYQAVFIAVIALFLVGAVLNLLLVQKLKIDSFNKFSGSFIIILFTTSFFYRLMVEMPTMHLHRLPMFWFNSGFLLFCSGALFLYAFTDYLIHVLDDDLKLYWSFHNLLFIVMDLLILVGIRYDWIAQREKLSTRNNPS